MFTADFLLTQNKLFKVLLFIPAKIYEFAVRTRIALYEAGYLHPNVLTNPVISVGNLTLGGTGKTPIVEYIARYLTEEGHEVAVLTRGYARTNKTKQRVLVSDGNKICASLEEAGDEALMLAHKLEGVKIVIGPNRYANGLWLEQNKECEVHILDDGFQHLQLKRDLNLLVLDATDLFGNGNLFPFGTLREPLYALKRADAILVTRADRSFDQDELQWVLSACEVQVPVIYTYHDVVGLYDLKLHKPQAQRILSGKKVGVVCALGNPSIFIEDITNLGAQVIYKKQFRDHHNYTQSDVDDLLKQSITFGVEMLVTTEKDAVKLEKFDFKNMPISVIQIKAQIEDEVSLKSMLLRTIVKAKDKHKKTSSSKNS